jgi:hypothetical protein
MLDEWVVYNGEKDYVVYRDNRTGKVLQIHKGLWAEWERETYFFRDLTMLVNNVTQNEARRFCQLTKED